MTAHYKIDAHNCVNCGKPIPSYNVCSCAVDAERVLLKDKVQIYLDTMMSMFNRINAGKDIYYEGLIRGQITAYEKVMELINEMGGKAKHKEQK